jgi:phage terminase large subunit GpA-like protein
VAGIHAALDDPTIREIVCMKSAQVAWTDGVLLNYLGRRIHLDPAPAIVMFAKEGAAKEFASEKLVPMIEASPALSEVIPVNRGKRRGDLWHHKSFPGGFLKLVGSNSAASVKSTPAPIVAIEEPDDAATNVAEQGDSITLLKERTKTFARPKIIWGGTPTVKGDSRIETAFAVSDQRRFMVPCGDCGELQDLRWEQVRWADDAPVEHEVYGKARPETARYVCAHCGALWDDQAKNRAVKEGVWVATAPFTGVAGFAINELYSPFPGSALQRLAQKWLEAQHAFSQGDDSKLRAFVNSSQGLPYAFGGQQTDETALAAKSLDYAEHTVPAGGLLLTAGIDVQRDRLAIVLRAWGRGEESWLVWWGELFGQTAVPGRGAWEELDVVLERQYAHELGGALRVSAVSIDSGDGVTAEAVYHYVRGKKTARVMAVKGASEQASEREIFSAPRQVDTTRQHKSAKFGLRVYSVGVGRAKDLILGDDSAGRIRLDGFGPGRMHCYAGVRPDYWEQLLAEVKAAHPQRRHKRVWIRRAGQRNEALDCEVYALHAARSLKTHLMKDAHWRALEAAVQPASEPVAQPAPEPRKTTKRPALAPRKNSFMTRW